MGLPILLSDGLDLDDDAVVGRYELVEDARGLGGLVLALAALLERFIVEEIGPVSQDGVGVDVVDARQEEVVRVDQVVRDGGEVGLTPKVNF